MQVSGALGGGWDIYRRFWRHLVPIALVVYLAISLLALLLVAIAGPLGAIVSAFISIAGVFWLQAALVEAVADVRDGRADLSLTETLRRVWPRVPTVAIAGILAGLSVALGLVLLIAPGLYLLTIWSLIIPAIVLEQKGIGDSFGRSRELVRGHGWTVFGVILVTFLLLVVFGVVLGLVLSPLNDSVASYLADVVSNTVLAPFAAATWTVMYFELKAIKEPATESSAAGAAYSE